MDIYISSYNNFHTIPRNILCVGVTKEIPKEFQTTSIHNFLYTPNSILGGLFPSDGQLTTEQFLEAYKAHLEGSVRCLEFSSLTDYFGKLFSSLSQMNDGEFKGVCFLGNSMDDMNDIVYFLKSVLEDNGYKVRRFTGVSSQVSNSLF